MQKLIVLGLLALACGTAVSGAGDPGQRLLGARSLRCTYTSSVQTYAKSGHRSVEQTNDKGTAFYNNIDVTKGTAKMIANGGAGDLVAWRDQQNSLWMLERSPSGNEVVTTVFPMYAEGTDEFVVVESRHWLAIGGQVAAAETAFGRCKVLW